VWNTRNTDNRIKTNFSPDHEYIFVYGKSQVSRIEGRVIDRSDFKNLDNDPRGPYVTDPLTGKATADERPNLHAYSMAEPGTTKVWEPDPAHGWITDEAGYKQLLADNRIWWPTNTKRGKPRKKRFLSETKARMPASSFWTEFRSQSGANDLDDILTDRIFAFPKPIPVIQRIIDYCAPENSIVMDSFGGSGTTAHAILKQNTDDGGSRRFILIEMDPKIARGVTAERVKRVASGYTNAKDERVEGLGGGFRYVQLGEPLFDAAGKIKSTVRFRALARHVFFTETGTPLPHDAPCDKPLLGVAHGTGVYLLYNGILKDKSVDGGNVLTQPILDSLPKHDGPKVIYAASNRVSPSRLKARGITFKQTPYAIKVR